MLSIKENIVETCSAANYKEDNSLERGHSNPQREWSKDMINSVKKQQTIASSLYQLPVAMLPIQYFQ